MQPTSFPGQLVKHLLIFFSAASLLLPLAPAPAIAQTHAGFPDIATADRAMVKYSPAYQALQDGRMEDASQLLHAMLSADSTNSYAHQLLCRVFYAQEAADEAIHECELAVASPSSNAQVSASHLWLGRAYGMKARNAGPFAGFSLARKVQSNFARAVELDSSNVAAINDLGEYDVNAPFIVGGGTDKAEALAAQVMSRFPGSAHLLRARIAVEENDVTRAEAEFKQVIAIQRTPDSWFDLAHFYQTHNRTNDAVAAVKSGLALDRTHGPALVDAASVLIAANREPALAEHCLREYLSSSARSDAAPAFKVHLQLSKLLAARGDTQGANNEVEAATALAPQFSRATRRTQGI